jgi:nucleotide-binding universal stress UspA family protein
VDVVVVGVDGSPSAARAVELAFDEAAARGCALVAVRAYVPSVPAMRQYLQPPFYDPAVRDDVERRMVEEALAPGRAQYPRVPVRVVLYQGGAARILARYSRTAQLVVIGHRRRGALAFGSVGRHLRLHARCPVLIAPA